MIIIMKRVSHTVQQKIITAPSTEDTRNYRKRNGFNRRLTRTSLLWMKSQRVVKFLKLSSKVTLFYTFKK